MGQICQAVNPTWILSQWPLQLSCWHMWMHEVNPVVPILVGNVIQHANSREIVIQAADKGLFLYNVEIVLLHFQFLHQLKPHFQFSFWPSYIIWRHIEKLDTMDVIIAEIDNCIRCWYLIIVWSLQTSFCNKSFHSSPNAITGAFPMGSDKEVQCC